MLKYNNLRTNKELIFIIVIGIVFYFNDYISGKNTIYKNCKYPHRTQIYLFLHHLLSSFLKFGWIFNSKAVLKIYICSLIAVLIIQYIYTGCPSTFIINRNCELPRNTLLKDFLYLTGIKSSNYIYIYYLYIFISISIAYKKITN